MGFATLFTSFSGRINRAKFWIAIAVYTAINLVMATLIYVADEGTTLQTINGIVSVLLLISGIAVGIKRLHDRNKTGWYLLLFYFAPSALLLAAFILSMQDELSLLGGLLALLALAIMVWSFIELGCLRGTIGQNKYGPDPIAPDVLTPPVRTHA
jgi:uncharacterized membrane protein YhaH (DUF805 family)